MGRRNQDIPFVGSSGLNESISPFQIDAQGATIAQNVYFEKFGEYTSINKRKGMTRINETAAGVAILGVYQFEFNATKYLQAFSDNGVMQSVNLTTGAIANITTGLSPTFIPDMSCLGNKAFFSWRGLSTQKDVCDAAAGWTPLGTNACTVTLNTTRQYEGTGCLVSTTDANLGALTDLVGLYYNFASFSGVGYNLTFWVSPEDMTPGTSPFQYHREFKKIKLSVYSDATGTNGAYWNITTDVDGILFPRSGFHWSQVSVSLGSTPTGTYGTGLTVNDVERILIQATDWDSGDSSVGKAPVMLYLDDIQLGAVTSTLVYATDNSAHSGVGSSGTPYSTNYLCTFDGRLFVAGTNLVSWSAPGDGTNWTTDASSISIDDGDGDRITGLKALGQTLFVFKQYSIHKILKTGDKLLPYRREPIYTGSTSEKGVGCIARRTIQTVILGGLQDNYYGKQEYLFFLSANGLYAINEVATPTKVDARVKPTLEEIPEAHRQYCFACSHPEKDQYILFYPTGSTTYTVSQLVYGAQTKQWSKYNWSNMTAAVAYRAADKTYVIMGNKDGYMFKHDYQLTDALADYKDDDNAGALTTAIDAQWASVYNAYKNPERVKSLMETAIMADATATSCPITVTVDNEVGTTTSETIATTSSTEWVNTRIPTKISGKYLRHKFSNANLSQSMSVYMWSAMLKQGRETK